MLQMKGQVGNNWVPSPKHSEWMVVELSCLSYVQLFATPWTVAHQAPLSMGFSRQEYWSGLPFPSPEDIPDPGIKPVSLISPVSAEGSFTTSTTWKLLSGPEKWSLPTKAKHRHWIYCNGQGKSDMKRKTKQRRSLCRNKNRFKNQYMCISQGSPEKWNQWICIQRERFIIQDLFLGLWRLTSPRACSQEAGDPGKPVLRAR